MTNGVARALDVGPLPENAFGHRSVMWWATICLMAIEGTVFALCNRQLLYLQGPRAAVAARRPSHRSCSGAR